MLEDFAESLGCLILGDGVVEALDVIVALATF
jgi:hypothetical protein